MFQCPNKNQPFTHLFHFCASQKVRERLLSRQKGLEQREKARKLRELKKFGKKVVHGSHRAV